MDMQPHIDQQMIQLVDKSHTEEIGQVVWNGHSTPLGILNFSTGRWNHLKRLILYGGLPPFIGDRGCNYLSRVSLPRIKSINLSRNNITVYGVTHLSKAPWKTLQQLYLHTFEDIERASAAVHSLQMLVRANWPSLNRIGFDNHFTTTEPMKFLLLSQNMKIVIHASSLKLEEYQVGPVRCISQLKGYKAILNLNDMFD